MKIAELIHKAGDILTTIKALPYDGGPSVTRWVFLRIAEAVIFGWLCLVGALVYGVVRHGHGDGAVAAAVCSLAAAMFGFASNNLNQRRAVQGQAPSSEPPQQPEAQ
jgi:hypothetical protein